MQTAPPGAEHSLACPICASNAQFAFHSPHVPVYKCGNSSCGHLFAEAVESRGVDQHTPLPNDWRFFEERDRRLVGFLARAGVIAPDSRVLDFGAGTGHLADAVERFLSGGSVLCVEAEPGLATALQQRGMQTVRTLSEAEGPFDGAFSIEVVEHLADPVSVLSQIRHLLGGEGRFFLSTPCGEDRRGRHHRSAYASPAHVQFFTECSLRRALGAAGFARTELRVVDEMYPRESGLGSVGSLAKTVGRQIRARLTGPVHLTAIAYAT